MSEGQKRKREKGRKGSEGRIKVKEGKEIRGVHVPTISLKEGKGEESLAEEERKGRNVRREWEWDGRESKRSDRETDIGK